MHPQNIGFKSQSHDKTVLLKDAIHSNAPGSVNRVLASKTDGVLFSHRYSPAHEFVSPATDHLSLTQALHFQATEVMGNMGFGWHNHFCREPKAIHILPPYTASEWRINGPTLVVRLSIPMALVHSIWEELEISPNAIGRISDMADSGFSEPFIHDTLNRLWTLVRAETECPPLLLQSYLVCILHSLGNRHAQSKPRPPEHIHDRQLRCVLDLIEDRIHDDLCIADLAKVACVSSYHFIRLFRVAMGRPPYQYIQHRRMEKARLLLATSKLSVGEIASAVGFNDAPNFSRTFARHIGMTPTQYRIQEKRPHFAHH